MNPGWAPAAIAGQKSHEKETQATMSSKMRISYRNPGGKNIFLPVFTPFSHKALKEDVLKKLLKHNFQINKSTKIHTGNVE